MPYDPSDDRRRDPLLNKIVTIGLTFDDVLLLPGASDVVPSEADTSSRLTRELTVAVPLLSSAMDTVTEARMAIAMARQGGIGVLHRNLPPEEQAAQVDQVKRSEAGMVSAPITCAPDATIAEAEALMGRFRISGVPVTDTVDGREGVLVGIVTNRDIRFERDLSRRVGEVMTPMPLVTAPVGVSGDDAMGLLARHKIEKLPLVDATGVLRGLITVKDFRKSEQYPQASKDARGRLLAAAAIGVGEDGYKRAQLLVDAGADLLVVDTAHGHSRAVLDTVARLKADTSVQVAGGNVATYDGARALVDAGADAVKVGVGPGCFAAGTGVLMADGTQQPIETVVEGDRVITGSGKPTTVLRSWCTGVRDVVAVRHTASGGETLVTPDHRFLCAAGGGAPQWQQIGRLAGASLLRPRQVQLVGAASTPGVVAPLSDATTPGGGEHVAVALLAVRTIGDSAPVYDIEVEDDSHSFVADGVIVHNSICTTRVVAGVGVPQITAIADAVHACAPAGVPVIADGGVQYSGDIVKALAVGASTVMLGSLLAGVEESPGELIFVNGKQYKSYRGMGSLGAMANRGKPGGRSWSRDRYAQDDVFRDDKLVPEGIEGQVPYRGALSALVYQLVGGLRQGLGYAGAATVDELREHARLVRITSAGLKESHPHDIQMTVEAPNYQGR